MDTNENACWAATQAGVKRKSLESFKDSTNNFCAPVERLLSRLDGVRRSGKGWTARCPAHQDKTASLSVCSGDDGRALIHCFAMCNPADVLAAVGLELGDLFPVRNLRNMSYAERAAMREQARQTQWRAGINILSLEATVVLIAARQIVQSMPLNEEDIKRIALAENRISDAKRVLCAR